MVIAAKPYSNRPSRESGYARENKDGVFVPQE